MNWIEIETNWPQMVALLKTHWPQLTNEDIEEINGSRPGLAVVLAHRCGLTPKDAEQEICEFEKDVRLPGAVK